MVILTVLILPIQEHGISFQLFVWSSISFISVLQFSECRSFDSLDRFIPRYLILLFFFKFIFMAVSGLSCGTQDLCRGTRDLLLQHEGSSLQRVNFSLVVACGFSLL